MKTYNDGLEWAAKWIEDTLSFGETNERTIEFGKNMAITIRAAKEPESKPTVAQVQPGKEQDRIADSQWIVAAGTEELRACPFCGAAGSIYYHGEDYVGSSQVDVGCSGGCEITPRACGDTNPESEQDEKWAIQVWNTRATPTPARDVEREAREKVWQVCERLNNERKVWLSNEDLLWLVGQITEALLSLAQSARELPHWSEPPHECTAFDRLLEPAAQALSSITSDTDSRIKVPHDLAEKVWTEFWEAERQLLALSSRSSQSDHKDGWVTFGRVTVDIENETEKFERIHPPTKDSAAVSPDEDPQVVIKRLTQWQDLCFELLTITREWTAPGSVTDLEAPRVLRTMLAEWAELKHRLAVSPNAEAQAREAAEGIVNMRLNGGGISMWHYLRDEAVPLVVAIISKHMHQSAGFEDGVRAAIKLVDQFAKHSRREAKAHDIGRPSFIAYTARACAAEDLITALESLSATTKGSDE